VQQLSQSEQLFSGAGLDRSRASDDGDFLAARNVVAARSMSLSEGVGRCGGIDS